MGVSTGYNTGGYLDKLTHYFSEPDFENGMEAIQGLGSLIVDLAEGVMKMASKTFIDPITGKSRTLNKTDFDKAGANIKAILTAVKKPISDIGKGGGWFSDNNFVKGLDSIKGLGSEMVNLADGVKKMALMTFIDPLDPTKNIELKQKYFDNAGANIVSILDAIKGPISKLGESNWWSKPTFKKGLESLHGTSEELLKLTEAMIKIQELQSSNFSIEDSEKYLTGVVRAFTGPFDGGKLKVNDAKTITGSYRKMIDDVVKLSRQESKLGKVANHLERISDSMIQVVGAFDKISNNKLSASKEFFNSLVAIEKINADTFKAKLKQTIIATDKITDKNPFAASNANQNKEDEGLNKIEDGFAMMQKMMAGLYEIMDNINTTLQNNTLKVDVVSIDRDINL